MTKKTEFNFFKAFDTETISENGSWLHFTNPVTKALSYLDEEKTKPFRMKFKGPDSDEFQRFLRRSRQTEKTKERDIHEDRIHDSKLFCKMLLDWENVPDESGGVMNDLDKDYAMKLFVGNKDLRVQILAHVMNQENFTKTLLEA